MYTRKRLFPMKQKQKSLHVEKNKIDMLLLKTSNLREQNISKRILALNKCEHISFPAQNYIIYPVIGQLVGLLVSPLNCQVYVIKVT